MPACLTGKELGKLRLQMHGHLKRLRLRDGAQALPEVIEDSESEGLGHLRAVAAGGSLFWLHDSIKQLHSKLVGDAGELLYKDFREG